MLDVDNIFKSTLEQVPVPVIILDYASLEVTYRNLAAARIIGNTATKLKECCIAVQADELAKAYERFQSNDPEKESKFELAGSLYRVTFHESKGKCHAVVQIDHTDLVADYRAIYDSLPIMVSQKTEVDFFHNAEFFRFTGQDRGTESETRYLNSVHPDDRADFVNQMLNNKSPTTPPINGADPRSESYRWVKTEVIVSGEKRTYLTFDVHEIYLKASEVPEKELQLKMQKQENQKLLDGESIAKEGNRLKGEFLANTSHEIRTPIAGVIGMVDLLLDTELDSEQKDYADSIRSSADALLTVINDVLDFSKIEAGKMQIDVHPFELTQMIRDIETMLSFMTAKKNLGLDVHIDPGRYELLGDRGRVRQILTNLLSNAIKFTQKGRVGLTITREEDTEQAVKIRFVVSDTGSGMTEHTVQNLFRPFAQGDAGRTYGGTGLGLSICKKLIELLEGEIGTETKLGKGTKFWFWLRFPRAQADQMRRHSSDKTPSGESGTSTVQPDVLEKSAAHYSTLRRHDSNQTMQDSDQDEDESQAEEEYPPRIAINQSFSNPTRPGVIDRAYSTNSVMTVRANGGEDGAFEQDNDNEPSFPTRPEFEDYTQNLKDPDSVEHLDSRLASREQRGSFSSQSSAGPMHSPFMSDTTQSPQIGFSPDDDSSSQHRTSVTTSSTTQAGNDKRILLAEDNDINCKIATSMLRKLGYACTVVKNGQEAVDVIDEQSSFDLVLMDVQMPILDGYEATALIRKSPNISMRSIPVIALTASAVSGDRERCIAAGMDDYITKPVNKKNLEKKLQKWLDR
ncbi:Putative uncharacterized protein [Taphrina deformans PYCC 5710]|uniref:histidine kinase n=1 Tax=Taphrina deformans (strain PYCC 5710 / ATCC 11124 / CBS 356.35 / IMI 108563 / JCM 9778 / NBRC 8474) TaxID=1097556 RepID=R4XH04_TAPDE|nr:Putative uncharacterized protein [Taphrina deformans PYCC 5710]|eukprot:CCG82646.1 Putative uncharacterized protein [Taphrina deformans PYCC 5710]